MVVQAQPSQHCSGGSHALVVGCLNRTFDCLQPSLEVFDHRVFRVHRTLQAVYIEKEPENNKKLVNNQKKSESPYVTPSHRFVFSSK